MKKTNPTISIIIPTYKAKDFIKNIIDEALSIRVNKEIIIVDDGSPDNTFDYCKSLFSEFDEVQLFSKENGGVSSARNFGLKNAKGKYVCFFDQDDSINPLAIESAIRLCENNRADILFWETRYLYDDGTTKSAINVLTETTIKRDIIINDLLLSMLFLKESNYISHIGQIWGAVFNRLFLIKNGMCFKHFVNYEDDYLFVFDSLIKAQTVSFVNQVAYFWFQNKKSQSNTHLYISQYIEKREKMLHYLMNELATVIKDKFILDYFEKAEKQNILIYAVDNAVLAKNNKADWVTIKNKLFSVNYRNIFCVHSYIYRTRIERINAFLLKYRAITLCKIVMKMYCFYRDIIVISENKTAKLKENNLLIIGEK